jgi:hypothetical protein
MNRLRYDRALLLHGPKRNEELSLAEVEQYGSDSFSDRNYISIYGMPPHQWYNRGIRLLGRTAVECTRDALGDLIGRDVASIASRLPAKRFVVVDPFAGSCNTLYWILRHLPNSHGVAFELDPQVFDLTARNIVSLDQTIELIHGNYESLLENRDIPYGQGIVAFVAPPWGTALDEVQGLDLRHTTPPITQVINRIAQRYPDHKVLFATQVYERVHPASLADIQRMLDWTEIRVYGINTAGRNHGILLGTKGWTPG